MFPFSKRQKIRPENQKILAISQRVLDYRRDVLSAEEIEELENLQKRSRENEEIDVPAAENLLKKCGGKLFPQSKIAEYTELLIVALILACGVRQFFVQPFKIPTNSMFPTYNGVVTKVCDEQPAGTLKFVEKILCGNSYFEIKNTTNASGEIVFPLTQSYGNGFSIKPIRSDGNANFYQFFVGNTPLVVELPKDASFENLFVDTFFSDEAKIKNPREILLEKMRFVTLLPNGSYAIKTGKTVAPSGTIFSFYLKTGDMVLVDRIWYHFFKPSVGDPFVFRTKNIAGLNYQKLYYIKRLAGRPGDKLQVKNGQIFSNDAPLAGTIFDKNNARSDENYFGYLPTCGNFTQFSWPLDEKFVVPANYFFALGDNSWNSYDSRGWGGVPAFDTVGPARFVIYPLSNHWGIAK